MSTNNKNNQVTDSKEEISLLDILVEFTKNLKLTIRLIVISFLIGLAFVLFKTSVYTASSGVVAELDNGSEMRLSSGLSALKSFGLNLGSAGSGLLPETYPELIKSREVLYQVIHMPFYFKSPDSTIQFVDYIGYKDIYYYLKKYTIKLPFTIIGFIRPKLDIKKLKDNSGNILSLSEDEHKAVSILMNDIVSTKIDDETGIITINVSTSDRNLSAYINEAVLSSFQNHIRQIYNQKNSENLNFIKTQLQQSKSELRKSEQAVVKFLEQNSNPKTIQLQTELERLKRDVSFKAGLYSELQIQYTQTSIELKKKEPVIRIVERPTPPINPSGLGKITILIIFMFIGFLTALIIVFYNFIIINLKEDEVNREKMNIIKTSFYSFFPLNYILKKKKQS